MKTERGVLIRGAYSLGNGAPNTMAKKAASNTPADRQNEEMRPVAAIP